MSYIQLVASPDALIAHEWFVNPWKAFTSVDEKSQCGYLLHQALFINLLKSVYRVVPTILASYVRETIDHIAAYTKYVYTNPSTEAITKAGCMYMEELLKSTGVANYPDLIDTLDKLNTGLYPVALLKDTYVPYLTYFGLIQQGRKQDISLDDQVGIPTFSVRGRWLLVDRTAVNRYHMNDSVRKAMTIGPVPLREDSYFGYLCGMPWNTLSFTALTGILSSYCFDLDRASCPEGSYEPVYAVIRSVLVSQKSAISPYVDSLTSFDDTYYRRAFVSLVLALRKLYNLPIENSGLLAEFLSGEKEEGIKDLTRYLSATTAETVSAEMQSAFRKSVFSQFEELDIKHREARLAKRNVSSGSDASSNLESLSSSKESLDARYRQVVGLTEPAPFMDKKKQSTDDSDDLSALDSEGSLDDALNQGADEDDSPVDGDAGATGEDDTSGTGSDMTQEPSATENGNPTDPTNQDQTGEGAPDTNVPDPADVSDKKGVKIELASSESTDTLLWRRELKAYLKKVIANPPRELSVEKIEGLRNVLAYLLNILSPQSVYDVVNSLIKLPSEFKIHKHNDKK